MFGDCSKDAARPPQRVGTAVSGQVPLDQLGAKRAELQSELDGLLGVEQHNLELDTFIESLDQAKDALNDLASDTNAVTGTIGEHKESLEQAAEALQQANGELSDFLSKAADAGGKVKDGVDGLATSATAAAEKIEGLNAKLKKIRELIAAGDGDASDMLVKFDEYFGDLVGELEPFLGRIPGLGAFIQIWTKAIRNITVSAKALEAEVASRNKIGREAGLDFDLYIKALGSNGQRKRRIAELQAAIEKLDEQIGDQTAVEAADDRRIRNAEHGLAQTAIGQCLDKAKMSREEFAQLERDLALTRRDLMVAFDVFVTCEGGLGLDGAGGAVIRSESEVARANRRMDQAARDMERLGPRFEELRKKVQPIYDCANDTLTEFGTEGIRIRMRIDARSLYGGFRVLGDPDNLRLERTAWNFGYRAPSVHAVEEAVKRHKKRRAAAAVPSSTPAPAAPKKQRKVAMAGVGAAVLIGAGALVALNSGPACASTVVDPDCPPELVVMEASPEAVPSPSPSPSPEPEPTPEVDESMVASLYGALYTLGTFTESDVEALLEAFTDDELRDILYSISSIRPGREDVRADIAGWLRAEIDVQGTLFDDLLGNTEYPCGRDDGEVIVVCVDGAPPLAPGAYAIATMELAGDVAGGPAEPLQAVYAYVVDSDGDPANDWVPQGDFDWDFFQGADTWFQLQGDLGTGTWTMSVSQVDAGQQISGAALPARAIIRGDSVTFVVPAAAVPTDAPYRLTAFVHDGSFQPQASGGDVTGTDPTEPLSR